ncbi:hypothetical protein CALVIDRAFT_474789 [Calocera viscosa TUFC12733]|uniref:D-aminoacyl-tRNA deacylase n=1 Tax=Calocera viscosa (strain TUFC12733) TaxID=1330018 RepID=A0A167RMN7_CALVF|nr:hypothetical protein CALVIDRAFT_474789 [Calocera viscosa TUFC12733]
MRAVIQRVSSASVTVDSEVIARIGRGLLVLVGIGLDDTPADSDYLVRKLLALKLFEAEPSASASSAEAAAAAAGGGMWKRSVVDISGEILCVSQFTLLANTLKAKPDFHLAMPPLHSLPFYTSFLASLRAAYVPEKVQDGRFGALMQVGLCNEGPVTVLVDSRRWEYVERQERGKKEGSGSSTPGGEKKSRGKTKSGSATPATAEAASPALIPPAAENEAFTVLVSAPVVTSVEEGLPE